MLDCGAFNCWTKGKVIRIADYISFVREVEPYLWQYIALDVIPGRPGRPRTFADVEAAAAASHRNLRAMQDAGLRALPTFHQGEDIKWLGRMLTDGQDFICISSAKNYRRAQQQSWLDLVFSVLTDSDGRPLARVHALGSVHYDWLQRYPFYSVDSAGWVKGAAHGKVYAPPYRDGQPDYLGKPELVTVSGRYQSKRYSQHRQLSNPTRYGPQALADICHFFEHECRLSLEQVRSEASARRQVMAIYYQAVRAALPTPIRFYQKVALLGDELRVARRLQATRSAIEVPELTFFFATQPDRQFRPALASAGVWHHLLSYAQLKNRPDLLTAYALG